MNAHAEKIAGTDLTPIAEYTETALALAELQGRFKNLVVDVSTPKGLKTAKADVAELRTLRTSLEKRRKELGAPLIERKKLVDDEAKRITTEIVALEEPIKLQVDAEESRIENARLAKLEAERLRVEALQAKIQQIRDVPASLVGKPSVIIAGQVAKLEAEQLDEDEFAEFFVTARDALDAAIARVKQLHADQAAHEAEQKRIAAEREELARMRAENERLQREADDRAAADRAEADRLAQVERDRVAAEERAQHEAEQAARDEAARIEREEQDRIRAEQAEADRIRREQEEAALQAERDRQAEAQRKLDEQAEQLRKEKAAAAKKAEADRLANLGLREAAQAVVDFAANHYDDEQVFVDLRAALANDENRTARAVTVNRSKKTAA